MSSTSLGESELVINKYLPDFENNRSKFLRECIQFYDEQHTKTNNKNNLSLLISFMMFFFLGIGVLSYSISQYLDIPLFFIPLFFFISGLLLLVYSVLLIYNKKGGENRWTSQ